MKEKPLCKKKTGIFRNNDNLLSSGEYFIITGDNQMTKHNHNQLEKEVLEVESSLKSFKEIRQGDK